jgi:hypothetical protein
MDAAASGTDYCVDVVTSLANIEAAPPPPHDHFPEHYYGPSVLAMLVDNILFHLLIRRRPVNSVFSWPGDL